MLSISATRLANFYAPPRARENPLGGIDGPLLFRHIVHCGRMDFRPYSDAIADGLRAPGLQQRLDELEARRIEIEQGLAAEPTSPVRLHPNLAQVYRRQVERLQHALNDPEIRDEALQILRNLIEHVSIGPAENGIEIEIVGEIAKMIELSIGNKAKQPILDEKMSRSVKVVAGARNHLYRTRFLWSSHPHT